MKFLKRFRFRFRTLFANRKLNAEMEEEMRSHIEMQTRENIGEGMSPEDARYAALRQFGWIESIKETCRQQRAMTWVEILVQDLRYGLRILRKHPGLTLVMVLSLALGMGVNIMLFSLFNGIFLRPVPGVKAPGQIVNLKQTDRYQNTSGFAYPDYAQFRDHNSVFSDMFCWLDHGDGAETITLGNGPETTGKNTGETSPEEIRVLLVSDHYFSTLGVAAVLGRTFSSEETTTPGSYPVIVLSHRLWQRRFGSDAGILGRIVTLNGVAFEVVGIAPVNFFGIGDLRATDAWAQLMMGALLERKTNRDFFSDYERSFQVAGRLKPGVTWKQAEAALQVVQTELGPGSLPPAERASLTLQTTATFAPLTESMYLVAPIMLAVSLVLVIACANVANLLLGRAVTRRKEMGIRFAVGAARGRIIRQLMTESVLIALSGGALGLLAGFWFCSLGWASFQQSLPDVARYLAPLDLSPDPRTIAYTMLLSLMTALTFGLAPALAASRANPNAALKDENTFPACTFPRSLLRNLFVAAQVAACFSLLIGAGQLLSVGRKASKATFGYDAKDILFAQFDLFRRGYPESRVKAFQQQLLERLRTLPAVKQVSLARNTLARNRHVDYVSGDYFATMRIPLLRGRTFTDQDASSSTPVAIVSAATAHRLWPEKNPIGQHLTNGSFAEIVGVVGNVRNLREVLFYQPVYTPELPAAKREDYLYFPAYVTNSDVRHLAFLIKTSDYKPVRAVIRDEVRKLDPTTLVSVSALTQDMHDSLKFFEILQTISNLIGLIALVLAAVGIFGVVAYSASQRTREIGVRMALGAQQSEVLRLEMNRGLLLVLYGLAPGLLCAYALSRVLASALIDVRSLDPLTFLFASLGLAIVMLLACYLPARRATKVAPMVALRSE